MTSRVQRLLFYCPANMLGRWSPFARALNERCDVTMVVPSYVPEERRSGVGVRCVPVATIGIARLAGPAGLDVPVPRHAQRVVRSIGADVVHVMGEPGYAATWSFASAAHRLGVPATCRAAQNVLQRWPFPFSWVERSTLSTLDAVFFASSDARRVLAGKGRTDRVHWLPNGFDGSLFHDVTRPAASMPTRFLFAGRLARRKGLATLLDALASVESKAWVLTVVGDGPLRSHLQARAREPSLGGRVRLLPRVAHERMPELYAKTDVLVLPSETTDGARGTRLASRFRPTRVAWKEQFGMVVVEANACGVPVVGSTCGAIPEVVADAGWIFPEGDVSALTTLLGRLVASPAEISGKRPQALANAKRFTWAGVADSALDVWGRLADDRERATEA